MDKKVLNPGIMAFKFVLRAGFFNFIFVGIIGVFISGFLMSVNLENYEIIALWVLYFVGNFFAVSTLFKKTTMLRKHVPIFLVIVFLFEGVMLYLNNIILFKVAISILELSGLLKLLFIVYAPSVAFIVYKCIKMSVNDSSNNETITIENSSTETNNSETIINNNISTVPSSSEAAINNNNPTMTSNVETTKLENEPISLSDQMMTLDNNTSSSNGPLFNQSVDQKNIVNNNTNNIIQENPNTSVNNQINQNSASDDITII